MQDSITSLAEGLYLENSKVLIPWFKNLNEIAGLGGEKIQKHEKFTQLFWPDEKVFGGLSVSVQAYNNKNGIFHLTYKPENEFKSAEVELSAIFEILKDRFGNPNVQGVEEEHPFYRWQAEKICINLTIAERFMYYVSLSVSNGVVKNL